MSVASFETIFSHSVICLLVFSLASFAVQNLVSLIKSHWFTFAFISVVWETDLRKYCKVDVRGCFAYVLFQEFDGVLSYI